MGDVRVSNVGMTGGDVWLGIYYGDGGGGVWQGIYSRDSGG